jgi:hypothetical protein
MNPFLQDQIRSDIFLDEFLSAAHNRNARPTSHGMSSMTLNGALRVEPIQG